MFFISDPGLRSSLLVRRLRQVGVEPVERHEAEQEQQDDADDDPSGASTHRSDGTPRLGPPRHASGDEADESASHDPDRGPHRNGERAAAPVRDAFAPAQRIEEEDVHKSEGNPEDRPDENEHPCAPHVAKPSAGAVPDRNDPADDS